MHSTLTSFARTLLAAIFVVAGVRKAIAFKAVSGMMAGKGFPIAEVFLVAAIALDVIGGLLLIINWHAKYAAAALAVYTFALAVIFHGFWNFFSAPTPQFNSEFAHFMKNISIVGGLLLLASMADEESAARRDKHRRVEIG